MMASLITCVFLTVVFLAVYSAIRECCSAHRITYLDWRDQLLLTWIAFATLLWGIFQVTSLSHNLTPQNLRLFWIVVLLLAAAWIAYSRKKRKVRLFVLPKVTVPPLSTFARFSLIALVLYSVILITVGVVYPSSYADSMTYHLPRVYHWAENRSIYPYATPILRQIQMPPFAEYQILNLFLLSGSDRLAALVQVFSLFGCALAVSATTRLVGGNASQQLLAVFFTLSLPSAIVQATATQNDLAVALWAVTFVYFGIFWQKHPQLHWLALPVGLSLGLALFTKATAYVFLFPFCLWLAFSLLKESHRNILPGLAVILIAVGINAPNYLWNWRLFHNPLGESANYINAEFSPMLFLSSLIRDVNAQLHFSFANEETCSGFDRAFQWLHGLLGIADNDPRNTYYNAPGLICPNGKSNFYEASANSPAHYFLILVAMVASFWHSRSGERADRQIFWSIFMSYLLFLGVFKFQIGGTRLLNTFFILSAPWVILFLTGKHPRILQNIIPILFLLGFIFASNTLYRPFSLPAMQAALENRTRASLASNEDLYDNVDEITSQIVARNCRAVALVYGSEVWEYPFWLSLTEKGWAGEMVHILARNQTKIMIDSHYSPCAIITNEGVKLDNRYPEYHFLTGDPFSVFLK